MSEIHENFRNVFISLICMCLPKIIYIWQIFEKKNIHGSLILLQNLKKKNFFDKYSYSDIVLCLKLDVFIVKFFLHLCKGKKSAIPAGASPPKDIYELYGFVCAIGMYILCDIGYLQLEKNEQGIHKNGRRCRSPPYVQIIWVRVCNITYYVI